ncbi:MAG TPA: 2-hydroxychromene-2-carboxylate isomerase [Rhizomicrobium sp.]|nr:2-hydroxychromene-2-carboxylate isomerase [Rhizomicrobium sp.]
MPHVEFLFDFGSPNAYLAHQVIPQIAQRTGAKFTYVPVLLGGIFKLTNNQSPFTAFAHVKNKLAYEQLEIARFIKKHKLTRFQFNPFFPVNTLAIMRGAAAADAMGILPVYVDALFHHMWEDPKKLDDPQIIQAALTASGLPSEALMTAAQSAEVKQRLLDSTEKAVARGVFGLPTIFVGEEMFFGKDRLADVEAEILQNT